MDAAIAMVLERFPAVDRPNFRTMYAAAPVPAGTPFYRRLVVGTEDLIWLETSLPGSSRTTWVVSNDAGVTLATVELP